MEGTMENISEVAQLRERIDREVEALQMLKNGFAQVASHEMITHHYRALDTCYLELVPHVGEEAAIDTICGRIEKLL
jgi:hypothetical protein